MRLDDERESSNFEVRGPGGGGFGLPVGLPLGRGGLGCGSIILIGIISLIFGVNPLSLLGGGGDAPVVQTRSGGSSTEELDATQHQSLKILGSTERVWGDVHAVIMATARAKNNPAPPRGGAGHQTYLRVPSIPSVAWQPYPSPSGRLRAHSFASPSHGGFALVEEVWVRSPSLAATLKT